MKELEGERDKHVDAKKMTERIGDIEQRGADEEQTEGDTHTVRQKESQMVRQVEIGLKKNQKQRQRGTQGWIDYVHQQRAIE